MKKRYLQYLCSEIDELSMEHNCKVAFAISILVHLRIASNIDTIWQSKASYLEHLFTSKSRTMQRGVFVAKEKSDTSIGFQAINQRTCHCCPSEPDVRAEIHRSHQRFHRRLIWMTAESSSYQKQLSPIFSFLLLLLSFFYVYDDVDSALSLSYHCNNF